MFRKIVTGILLYCMAVLACSCYTLKSYPPQQVKPDWEIAEVVTLDSNLVHFDEAGLIRNQMVVGLIRNDSAEMRTRKVPLDSVRVLRVRKLAMSTSELIVVGAGAGMAVALLIDILIENSSTSNGNSRPPVVDGAGTRGSGR
jgi:hypothetical protein